MSTYVIPRCDTHAEDLIAQLESHGTEVVNRGREYEKAPAWVAAVLINEADEIVCLPHWEAYEYGKQDYALAVQYRKPIWDAHKDLNPHLNMWALEFQNEEGGE